MTAVHALLVAVGGMLGAPLRYYVDRAIQARHDTVFPWGTLTVNVTGSLLFGALTAGPLPDAVRIVAGAGFCGALTTYSTFGYETIRLREDGSAFYAGTNAVANLVAGLGAAVLGWAVASAV
jgi:fluoride exporter